MIPLAPIALALFLGQLAAAPQPALPAPPAEQAPPVVRTLTIDEALRLAAKRNWDLKAAEARLHEAEQGYWKALSGYLPQVTLGVSYTYQGAPLSFPFPVAIAPTTPASLVFVNEPIIPQNTLQGTADASQVLFSPALWYSIKSASQGTDSAKEATENARRQIIFGVAQAYYGVAALQEAVEISQRLLEIAQRQEKDARVRYQAGTIAKVGLLRAEIDRARAEQDLLRSRNAYLSGKLSLAQLIDGPPDFDVVTPEEPKLPADTSKLVDAALRDRADVKAARSALASAETAKSSLVSEYLPSVVGLAHWQNANVAALTGKELWSLGVALQWKIFDGGLREANIRESSARIDENRATLASIETQARKEVGQSILDLESARANALKAKEQRDLAAENQRLIDVSYRAGAATALEQADATTQLRNAELTQLTEVLNSYVAALHVKLTSGAAEP